MDEAKEVTHITGEWLYNFKIIQTKLKNVHKKQIVAILYNFRYSISSAVSFFPFNGIDFVNVLIISSSLFPSVKCAITYGLSGKKT